MPVRSALLNVMDAAAKKAARGLVRDFGEVEHLQVSKKGPSDFVSAADLRAEKVLTFELQKARPKFGFLREEGDEIESQDGRSRWIIDPLDGTTNFLHGLPHFAISIGLEQDGKIVAGLIHDPIKDETFWAEKGGGAFMNNRRLRVSARSRLEDAVIATGIPHRGRGDHQAFNRELLRVMEATAGVRRFGSAALDLAYVAAGRYDGFWEWGLSPWDIAAGLVIVQEAGGYVGEIDGGADPMGSGNVLAANAALHGSLAKLLQPA